MKTCLICGKASEDSEPTCPSDGEASWAEGASAKRSKKRSKGARDTDDPASDPPESVRGTSDEIAEAAAEELARGATEAVDDAVAEIEQDPEWVKVAAEAASDVKAAEYPEAVTEAIAAIEDDPAADAILEDIAAAGTETEPAPPPSEQEPS